MILLLSHIPSEVVGSWPSSSGTSKARGHGAADGDTLLEGLRLALAGGPGQAFSASSRLVVFKAMFAFVTHALEDITAAKSTRRVEDQHVDIVELMKSHIEGWVVPFPSSNLADVSSVLEDLEDSNISAHADNSILAVSVGDIRSLMANSADTV